MIVVPWRKLSSAPFNQAYRLAAKGKADLFPAVSNLLLDGLAVN
jgi:hypothetical protein